MSTLSLATRTETLALLIECIEALGFNSHTKQIAVAKVWLAELREEQGFREANPDVE